MKLAAYWYQRPLHPILLPLLPLSLLYRFVIFLKRCSYRLGFQRVQSLSLPVLIIGNLTAGGTGKTPLVLYLARYLKEQGKTPGIALRGVGGQKHNQPVFIQADSDPYQVGDEAVLLAKHSNCPVVACIDRPAAAKALEATGCDLILCDDGLQHYRLGRSMEICVIDGTRYFGNGHLLPAGPLRESLNRLPEMDFIVVNQPGKETEPTLESTLRSPSVILNAAKNLLTHAKQILRCAQNDKLNYTTSTANLKSNTIKSIQYNMHLKAEAFVTLTPPQSELTLNHLAGQTVHAVAGIGNPQRFFDLLNHLNIKVIPHPFPDHHRFQGAELDFSDRLAIVMTEKDAIKCQRLALNEETKAKLYFLKTSTEVSEELKQALLDKLAK